MAKKVTNKVKCPECGHEFDVEESFQAKAAEEAEKIFRQQIVDLQMNNEKLLKQLENQQQNVKEQQEKFEEKLKVDLEKQFKDETNKKIDEMQKIYTKQTQEMKSNWENEYNLKLKILQDELEVKREEAIEVSKLRLELEKSEKDKKKIQAKIQMEMQAQQEKFEEKLKVDLEKQFKDEANKRIKSMQDFYEQQGKLMKETMDVEYSEKMKLMQEQLEEKTKEALEVSKLKADVLKIQREKDEIQAQAELDLQVQLTKSLEEERRKLQEQAEKKYELKIAEMTKQLDDQKKLTEEMKRKQEQGSMQLQGETQELFIEKWLANTFPLDSIEEVKKGANGADCVQVVNTIERQNCGVIYYESKNTQSFGGDWIEKFKKDIKKKGADLGVLVTAVYPKGMTRMGVKDGVYICSLEEFKGLTTILREELIKTSKILASQENRQDKKELLYNYLTSQDFAMQISGIVGSYRAMKNDLEKEKTAMMKYWKYREKQLDNVIESATSISGSIQSIANILTTSAEPLLQLPGTTDDEDDDELIG